MPRPIQQVIRGKWGPGTAGGCPRAKTWNTNPQYLLTPTGGSGTFSIALRCAASPPLDIGFLVMHQLATDRGGRKTHEKVRTKELVEKTTWRPSDLAELSVPLSPSEEGFGFVIVPCTFEPGHQAAFELAVVSTDGVDFALTELFDVTPTAAPPARPVAQASGPAAALVAPAITPQATKSAVGMSHGSGAPDPSPAGLNEVTVVSEGQGLSQKLHTEAAEMVEAAVAASALTGGMYEDNEFPPSTASLWLDGVGPGAELQASGLTSDPVVSWRRPSEFAAPLESSEGPARLFYQDWGVQGIVASPLLNHWLLAACNIVGGDVEVIERVFVDTAHAANGFYVVRFYVDDPNSDDDWKVVLVDDRLPCGADGLPCFARNPSPVVLWAAIIEKAFAKFKGSYEGTSGGSVEDGLLYLTGGLSREVGVAPSADDDVIDALWAQMMEWWTTSHVIGCEHRINGEPSAELTATGLLPNLPYCVITGGEPVGAGRMVRLRTFHGYSEWRGKWSDGDPSWTSQLRQLVTFENNTDDGTFWMAFEDFVQWFNVLFTCRMVDDRWTRLTIRSRWQDTTAGGCCPNYASWRTNPQWLLQTSQFLRLTVSLSIAQPPVNPDDPAAAFPVESAMGISVLRGNAGADGKRRKLLLTSAEELIVRAEPRPVRRLVQEIALEPSEVPYVLMAHTYMPGREMGFNMVVRCDDENDDGIPDFQLEPVRPDTDWVQMSQLLPPWSQALQQAAPADEQADASPTMGGPPGGSGFASNPRLFVTAKEGGRFFLFLDQIGLSTDGRLSEGIASAEYPEAGLALLAAAAFDDGVVTPDEILANEQTASDAVIIACELAPSDIPYCVVPYLGDAASALAQHPELQCRVWVYSDRPFTLADKESKEPSLGVHAMTEGGRCICWGLGRFPKEQNESTCPILRVYNSLKHMEQGMDRHLKYLETLQPFEAATVIANRDGVQSM